MEGQTQRKKVEGMMAVSQTLLWIGRSCSSSGDSSSGDTILNFSELSMVSPKAWCPRN